MEVAKMLLKLKVLWYKTEKQMTFLREVWDSLDSSLQQNQHLLLTELDLNLRTTTELLNSIIGDKRSKVAFSEIRHKRGQVRRIRYALSVKGNLEATIAEFKEWQSLFDPSWYLIARVIDHNIDRYIEASKHPKDCPVRALMALRKSIKDLAPSTTQPAREISSYDFLGHRKAIDRCSAAIAPFEETNGYAIVDTMTVVEDMDREATARNVIALSKALSRMEPLTFGLLRCCGVINRLGETNLEKGAAYDFVFEIPKGVNEKPRSLRDLLLHQRPSLNTRMTLAKQLANSVFYLHTTGFVHKNIRPETILLFDRPHDETTLSFLVGFEQFRLIENTTNRIGDGIPERELYRHPTRQGNDPERDFVMQHDIYSFGVCLLEIGLWRSFFPRATTSEACESFLDADAELCNLMSIQDLRKRAFGIKKRLTVIAEEHLPILVGNKFTQVVTSCLTCLDATPSCKSSSIDRDSGNDVKAGVEFIENTLVQLQEIVI